MIVPRPTQFNTLGYTARLALIAVRAKRFRAYEGKYLTLTLQPVL